MAAAERGIWTAAQLRRLLATKAGYDLSAPSIGALMTGDPVMIKLSTLAALCKALDCTPDDLFELETAPILREVGHGPSVSQTRDTAGLHVANRSVTPLTAVRPAAGG